MYPANSGGKLARRGQIPRLSVEGHKQVLDLLRLADQSSNADIRAVALRIAEETSRHQRNQQSRVSPTVVVVLGSVVILGGASASWCAIVRYPGTAGWEICAVIFVAALLAIGLYTLLSGHLSEKSFMDLVGMIWSWLKDRTLGMPPGVISKVEAEEEKANSGTKAPHPEKQG